MKLKTLSTAMILAALPMSGAFAAAMDRSGQSISAFLQPGNYFEAGLSVLDADVSGTAFTGEKTGDMASSYYFPSAALKIQATDNISVGLLYDQPFGAKAEYKEQTDAFSFAGQGTAAEVETQNLTLLFGFQPNENWNFYAGPVYQEAKGEVALRGNAYSSLGTNGFYDANLKKDSEFGWIAGLAYQIPEIALKASLTYRSEIEHELNSNETMAGMNPNLVTNGIIQGVAALLPPGTPVIPAAPFTDGKTKVTTPQSVNLDLQSGIMENTVAFLNVRWVNWDGFAIRPNQFGQVLNSLANSVTYVPNGLDSQIDSLKSLEGGNLVEYNKDQWTVTGGVGRKFSEKWAGNVSVGWDSGAGNPVTTLGPTEGYWNVGLGLQFSPAPNYFIAGGVKYFWLGDATALTVANPNVGEFEDNNAIGYGLKIGYKF